MSTDHAAPGDDLLAWLENAITAREEKARALGGGFITVKSYDSGATSLEGAIHLSDATALHEDEIAWIVLNDPASALRRCAADRQLLSLHGDRCHSCPAKDETGYLDEWTQFDYGDTCPVMQLLAEGYGWNSETSHANTGARQTPPTEGDQVT